jgi:hypothetical protein
MPFLEEKSKWNMPDDCIPLYPAIVSDMVFFAGIWMVFDSLDFAAALRKPLRLWVQCPLIPLSDFGGKTV